MRTASLNTNPSVRRLNGPSRPINHLADRSAVLAAVESVDAVGTFEDTLLELFRHLKPDVLVQGADDLVDTVVGAVGVQAQGGRVVLVDRVEVDSTTKLIHAISSGSPTTKVEDLV